MPGRMNNLGPLAKTVLIESIMNTKIRLISGLVLLVFLVSHFLNHSLGVISPFLQEAAAPLLSDLWGNFPLIWVLIIALILHASYAMIGLYQRRHFKMPTWQKWQFFLGFFIPFLLIPHLTSALVFGFGYDINVTYPSVLAFFWTGEPVRNIIQILLLVVVWIHACIGFWSWSRLKKWYPKWRTTLNIRPTT
jgi:adenylate cyclase